MRQPSVRRAPVSFNMTPMIDIVFQLIIFFLVSSHLAQSQVQYELDLPSASTGKEPVEAAAAANVIINVLPPAAGQSEYRILLGSELVTKAELFQRLSYENSRKKQLEVHIRSSQQTPYRFIEPLLVICAKAGVWDVRFAVVNNPAEV